MPQGMQVSPQRSMEPIPGYRLYERVGAGGYGEVWSAEAPGELVKAVKFVYGYLNEERASREMKALQRIKGVRHPFILSLERIEIVDGHLLIVTELADCSLKDRFEVCRQAGQPGIPREELLSHLRDAADALDYMNTQHGLQHLDVKPENLLLVGGRIKVADFGLVKDMEETSASMMGGLTPLYAPPEVFDGRPSRRSDQYSLAIVYQEMLTGMLPFPGKTAAQLAAQHLSAQPRLNNLSDEDRSVIAKALAKNPEDRFTNCRELVNTLIHGGRPSAPEQGVGRPEAAKPNTGAFALPVPGAMTNPLGPERQAGGLGGATEVRPIRVPDEMLRDADIVNQTAILARDGREAEAEASLRQSSVGFPQGRQRFSDDVRQSVVGSVEPDRSALWSADDQSREVTDLPPLAVDLSQWLPVPTFFVGLGGTAGRTLQRLKRKLDDRFGGQRGALFPMFFLETDQRDAMRATHGDDGAPLSAQEVLTIPLRKSQDYRAESNRHLEWLSRRWLYNIPRSQQTEGVRPLGRLALVDHADDVRRQLRSALQSFLKSAAAARDSGQPAEVRIVVVGSISGATGGGAIADVAFLLRQLLDQQQATGEVMLLLAHSTCRQAAAQQLAQVNAYVTLAELNQCLRPGGVYPGDQSLKVDPRAGTAAGISSAYLVHMGSELSNEQYDAGCEQLAEFLFVDAGTPGGGYLRACRQEAYQENESCVGEFHLRSFGLCRVGFAADGLLDRKVDQLCSRVVKRWLGEPKRVEGKRSIRLLSPLAAGPKNEAADRDAAIDARAAQEAQACGLDSDTLLRHAYQAAEKELGTDALSYFRKLMWGVARSRGEGPYPVDQCLAALDNLFGPRHLEVGVAALKVAPLPAALNERIKSVIVQIGGVLQLNMVTLADDTNLRLYGAQRVVKWIGQHLKVLAERFHEMRAQVTVQMDQMGNQIMQAAGLDPRGRGKGSAKTPSHVLEGMLVQYAQMRLMQLASESAAQLSLGAQGFVAAAGDKVVELSREVRCLATLFGQDEDLDDLDLPSPGDDVLAGLRQGVVQSLAEQIESLAQGLDQQICASVFKANGFRRTILQGGQQRDELIGLLKREARKQLLAHVQTADFASMLMGPQQHAGCNPVQQLTAQAQPWLQRAGGQRRLICIVPQSSQSGCDAEAMKTIVGPDVFHETPAVVSDASGDLVFCFELAAIPISHAAAALIDHRPDYADLAYRLHCRSDIVWQALPPR
jgi:hypothetical protein